MSEPMSETEPFKITLTRHLAAPPERVFDAWLDPKSAAQWFFATETGDMIRAEIDPSVGGEFCFIDRRGDEDIEHLGEYTTIDRPRRLAFVFSVNQSDDVSRVAIDLAPSGIGTDLTLTHEVHPKWASFAERTQQGWSMILDGLAKALG
jgi:uncharacterized protein YndB with AHSA1/START domain